ncbi:MAG: hypothetical protein AABW51_04855 [Nanoarchaeota archaeon]
MTTLTKILDVCTAFSFAHPYYRFSLVHEGETTTVECYSGENLHKLIIGSVVVQGGTVIINDGHDSSLRDYLEKHGFRTN